MWCACAASPECVLCHRHHTCNLCLHAQQCLYPLAIILLEQVLPCLPGLIQPELATLRAAAAGTSTPVTIDDPTPAIVDAVSCVLWWYMHSKMQALSASQVRTAMAPCWCFHE